MNDYYRGGDEWGPFGMMSGGHEWWFAHVPVLMTIFAPILLFVVLWAIVWKGLALWHSARRGQPWWFVIFTVVHTMGILEIIYLFFVAKLKFKDLFSKHDGHHH